jgi:hypothetical protein
MECVATFFRLAVDVYVVIEQQFHDVLFVKLAHQKKGVPPLVIDRVDVDPSFQEEFNELN